jgi:hypothetical protein
MTLQERIKWIKSDTIKLAKVWKQEGQELTERQLGELDGRWVVINFLEGSQPD